MGNGFANEREMRQFNRKSIIRSTRIELLKRSSGQVITNEFANILSASYKDDAENGGILVEIGKLFVDFDGEKGEFV